LVILWRDARQVKRIANGAQRERDKRDQHAREVGTHA
jgi:hypothetical protein